MTEHAMTLKEACDFTAVPYETARKCPGRYFNGARKIGGRWKVFTKAFKSGLKLPDKVFVK